MDTGGAIWEQAVRYQAYGLVVAQLLLSGVLFKKYEYASASFIILLAVYTLRRVLAMLRKWGGVARALPLAVCVDLDAAAPPVADEADAAEYQRGGLFE